MIREVFMPALSSTMTEGKIVSWVKQPGDKVEKGETVVVVESDKADMDVESFYEGFLATIVVSAGETAPVGEAIALIAETEAEIEAAKNMAKGGAAPQEASTPPAAATVTATAAATTTAAEVTEAPAETNGSSGRVIVSPRARKLAKELKIDLATVKGSGPHGRVVAEDIEAAAGKAPAPVAPSAPPAPTPAPPPVPATPAPAVATPAVVPTPEPARPAAPAAPAPAPTPGQVVPLTTLQNAVVRNMLTSLQIPVYRVGYTITTDQLDKLYKQIKSKGVTMTALLAKAVAVTLKKHPIVNACYTEQGIQYNGGIHVAIAVAMDDGGLITPVLQNADQMDIYSLSRAWQDLVARARSKQLQPSEYSTGTFTISNLGMFGVDRFDAILPPGQGAIMAVGASRPQLVATEEGLFGVRTQMQVNVTCDHRVIYGAHVAAFLKDLAILIERDPQSLTL